MVKEDFELNGRKHSPNFIGTLPHCQPPVVIYCLRTLNMQMLRWHGNTPTSRHTTVHLGGVVPQVNNLNVPEI
jgi:hypothetical protein